MTAGEWDAYGDACASHENVTIDGVKYTDIVVVRPGVAAEANEVES